jgi:hypothetical protein
MRSQIQVNWVYVVILLTIMVGLGIPWWLAASMVIVAVHTQTHIEAVKNHPASSSRRGYGGSRRHRR